MSLLLVVLAPLASAFTPTGAFPGCAEDNLAACPNDFRDWELYGWIPAAAKQTVRPAELELGAGAHVERAFALTTGRYDVTVAVIDSGIEWHAGWLKDKVLLNLGEVPPPRDASGAEIPGGDLDGNGLITVSDYAEDPRVDIAAGLDRVDDRLDPSDLIYSFSDGIDDDGNGYVDDIAGWDFFGWDNDPYAQLEAGYSGHGSGVARAAVEAGDDGGGVGTCPNCSFLPLRIGETFITDGDRVAMAVTYATDRGARVASMAIGALTHPSHAVDAVRYAAASGLVMVSAAGDENSYHHNFPAMQSQILYVHSVRSDTADEEGSGVYSYMNTWNCNNYGPRIDVVAGSSECATGAVALTAGVAGLIVSAGRENGVELSSAEVRALLKQTAIDVFLTEAEREISGAYPSKEGWDAFFGYGRVNAGDAVEDVYAGAIPPDIGFTAPGWFSWPDVDEGPVRITGWVDAPHASGVSWELFAGRGAEPTEWVVVGSGDGPVDGLLAEVDARWLGWAGFSDLVDENVVERMYRAHEPLVTLRLVATDADGVDAVERVGFWSHPDPHRLDGFPLDVGSSLEGGTILADLDGDDVFEVLFTAADGRVHVVDGLGNELPGFPVRFDVMPHLEAGGTAAEAFASGAVDADAAEGAAAPPAVGDIDGDGEVEIVAVSLHGAVYAWHADGSPVAGFPVHIVGREPEEFGKEKAWDNGIVAAPALGDVDGDGDYEVVVGAMDQRLYVWDGDGSLYPGYPIVLCHDRCDTAGYRIMSTPALGDIDDDGDLDAAIGTNEVPNTAAGVAYVIDLASATVWPNWPQEREGLIDQTVLPVLGEGHPASVGLADLDGDGQLELASNAILGSADLIHNDGTTAVPIYYTASTFGPDSNVDEGSFFGFATNPAFGDLDLDGVPDLAVGGSGIMYLVSLALTSWTEYNHAIGAWSGADGDSFPAFPRQIDDVSFLNAPVIADISGDEIPEVIYGSGGSFLYAWDAEGNMPEGWPKFLGGWLIGAPSVGDIDGDGWIDVVASTREGFVFAWTTDGRADQDVQWPMMHHDAQNTGNYEAPLPAQAGPVYGEGCCGGEAPGSEGSALLVFLPLLWLRRRRDA